MFSTDDFQVDDVGELLEFLPILIFVALCTPYLIAAYSLGFVLNTLKLMD